MVSAGLSPREAVRRVETRLAAAGCPDADYDARELFRAASGRDARLSDRALTTEEAEKLELAVRSLQPRGGGDDPEDALEAVAYAIRSDWDRSPGVKHRHVIVVWTDAQAHELGFGKASSRYPKGMARSIGELTAWWGTPSAPGYCLQGAKRLVLFTPKEEGWDFLTEQWDQTVQFPSKAGNGLSELDYEEILNCLSASL